MLFSVIVPVYNAEKYLEQCIESILKQDFSDFELILVDDGSTDSSAAICDSYANDSRVRVIHKPNGGSVSARNAGIEASSGEYLCFADADDYIATDFLCNFQNIIEKYCVDVVAIGCTRFDENSSWILRNICAEGYYSGIELDLLKSRLIYDKSLGDMNLGAILFSLWSKCIKRDLFPKELPQEKIKLGDDMMLTMPIMNRCTSVYISDYCGYYYRDNPVSLVNTFREKDFFYERRLVSILEDELPNHREQLEYYFLICFVNYVIKCAYVNSSWREFRRITDSNISKRDLQKIRSIKIEKIPFLKRVQIFAVKYKIWWLIWIYGKVRA